jgi:probable F420-dependent oxidoreductase
MDFGIGYFPTAWAMGPGELAALIEERGQESLLFAEHSHIPASRESPYPGGAELPRKYLSSYDPFVALMAAAAATARLRIGTGVCLVIQRDPIHTAKEVATLDRLSGGRVEFGVGAGWNREEMADHGTDPRTRMRLLGERVEAIKAIWSQAEATFHGEFVNFDRLQSEPKPAQKPHPPILVGGDGPTVLDRVLAYGDAWMPNYQPGILERLPELRSRADRPISFQAMSVPPDPAEIEKLAAAGCDRALCWLPTAGRGPIESKLERWEAAIAEFTGEA